MENLIVRLGTLGSAIGVLFGFVEIDLPPKKLYQFLRQAIFRLTALAAIVDDAIYRSVFPGGFLCHLNGADPVGIRGALALGRGIGYEELSFQERNGSHDGGRIGHLPGLRRFGGDYP